jgi:hypothetical protein
LACASSRTVDEEWFRRGLTKLEMALPSFVDRGLVAR